ncbi:MAG: hypothetical protein N2316_05205 [Spirochaetes bacterium]|nr:hypothetical protein [Spirochaetota bacterium]
MRFELTSAILDFNEEKCILTCHRKEPFLQKVWIKKLPDVHSVASIKEDNNRYYVACEYTNTDGIYLALNKETGTTLWYIPGRSLLQIIYRSFPYIIFIDENEKFHLIKAHPADGRKLWHHPIDDDLTEYIFTRNTLMLRYRSGKKEILSLNDGRLFD